jgi:hypothetical protein
MARTDGFWSAQIQIDHNRNLSVVHTHSFAGLIRAGIVRLVRRAGGTQMKSLAGLPAEFELMVQRFGIRPLTP